MKLSDYGGGPHVRAAKGYMESKLQRASIRPALLVYGPPGVGKTTLAYALAEEYGLELVPVRCSEIKSKQDAVMLKDVMHNDGVLLLLDDVDLAGVNLGAELSTCKVPVILTANVLMNVNYNVRDMSTHVNVPPPHPDRLKMVGRAMGASPKTIARAKTYRDLETGSPTTIIPEDKERAILMGLGDGCSTSEHMNLDSWILDNTDGLEALEYDKYRLRYREVGACMAPYLKRAASLGLTNVNKPTFKKTRGGTPPVERSPMDLDDIF